MSHPKTRENPTKPHDADQPSDPTASANRGRNGHTDDQRNGNAAARRLRHAREGHGHLQLDRRGIVDIKPKDTMLDATGEPGEPVLFLM